MLISDDKVIMIVRPAPVALCPPSNIHCNTEPKFIWFLATLVALHFTPVSEWASKRVSHSFGLQPSSVAWSLRACFFAPFPYLYLCLCLFLCLYLYSYLRCHHPSLHGERDVRTWEIGGGFLFVKCTTLQPKMHKRCQPQSTKIQKRVEMFMLRKMLCNTKYKRKEYKKKSWEGNVEKNMTW